MDSRIQKRPKEKNDDEEGKEERDGLGDPSG
jgi:hypothetical protein